MSRFVPLLPSETPFPPTQFVPHDVGSPSSVPHTYSVLHFGFIQTHSFTKCARRVQQLLG